MINVRVIKDNKVFTIEFDEDDSSVSIYGKHLAEELMRLGTVISFAGEYDNRLEFLDEVKIEPENVISLMRLLKCTPRDFKLMLEELKRS
ncbi:MAG: hypothetical protein ACRC5T_01015 [Cetobacterium sp.]